MIPWNVKNVTMLLITSLYRGVVTHLITSLYRGVVTHLITSLNRGVVTHLITSLYRGVVTHLIISLYRGVVTPLFLIIENVKKDVKVHEESTETEDSDDSEEIPIPPPRKKKLQQSKSLDERKRNIPPPRPSYSPAKGALLKKAQEKKEENEIPTEQPNPKTGSESSSVFIHKELNLETKVPEVAINKQDFSVLNNSSDDDIIKSDSYTKEQVSELDEVKHDSHTGGEQELEEIKPDFHETEELDLVKPIPRPRHKKIITKNESSDMHQITNEINSLYSKTIDNQDERHSDKSGDTSSQEHSGRSSPRLDISGGDTPPQDRSSKEEEQLFQVS